MNVIFWVNEFENGVEMVNILVAGEYFCDLEVKSTKHVNSQCYFLLSNRISYIYIYIYIYILQGVPHIIIGSSALDFQDGQSWYVWQKLLQFI